MRIYLTSELKQNNIIHKKTSVYETKSRDQRKLLREFIVELKNAKLPFERFFITVVK